MYTTEEPLLEKLTALKAELELMLGVELTMDWTTAAEDVRRCLYYLMCYWARKNKMDHAQIDALFNRYPQVMSVYNPIDYIASYLYRIPKEDFKVVAIAMLELEVSSVELSLETDDPLGGETLDQLLDHLDGLMKDLSKCTQSKN